MLLKRGTQTIRPLRTDTKHLYEKCMLSIRVKMCV